MRQHGVAPATLGSEVLGNICQATRGHAHGLQTFNHGRQVHRLLGTSALHLLHLMQHGKHCTNKFRVVFFWHVPFFKGTRFNQFLKQLFVVARVLAHVFKDLNKYAGLLRGQLNIANILANCLFQSGLPPRVDHAKRRLRGIIRVRACNGQLLDLFALPAHALRHGHDSFICHDSPFQFVPKASWAARRERTR